MPYCPRCRVEYRRGFLVCADCGASLVDVLPPESPAPEVPKEPPPPPVVVHVANSPLEGEVIKGRLESEGIPAILQYESISVVYGITVDGIGATKVLVPASLAERAREVLAQPATLDDFGDDEEEDDEAGD
jgi:hypothetical protein